MTKKEMFFLNTTLHFVSDTGWEYEIRQRHSGPESDKNYYLWTLDDDLICEVPQACITFEGLYEFVEPIVETYEELEGRG